MTTTSEFPSHSPKQRYVFTLAVFSLVKFGTGLFNTVILPRVIEAAAYGNYQFVFRTASAVREFVSLGSESAFFTLTSKQLRSGRTVRLFSIWAICQLLILLVLLAGLRQSGYYDRFLGGLPILLVAFIVSLEWLQYVSTACMAFGEAKAETVRVQTVNLIGHGLKLAALTLISIFGLLSLEIFIGTTSVAHVTVIVILLLYYFTKRGTHLQKEHGSGYRPIIKYFLNYSSPYFIYTVYLTANSMFGLWYLQYIGGAEEMAYYTLALQWIILTMLPVNTARNVFWREVAFSHAAADTARVGRIFVKSARFFLFVSACFAAVVAFNAEWLVAFLLGGKYTGLAPVLAIMAFYPIPWSQQALAKHYFNGTDQIRLMRDTSLLTVVLGISLAYVLIAPGEGLVVGLDMGAQGLALRDIIVTVVVTILQMFLILRQLRIGFARFLQSQLGVVGGLLVLMYVVRLLVSMLGVPEPGSLILELSLFALCVGPVLYLRPGIAGITITERDQGVAKLRSLARRLRF